MASGKRLDDISAHVLNSKTMLNAPTSGNLLRFLVRSTLANDTIKESTIGLELLGKKYTGSSSDARIRVNIYHLRKKLESYYENEGKNDEYRITIPKGQYHVVLERKRFKSKFSKKSIYITSLLVNLFLLAFISWFLLVELSPKKLPIWNSYFKNGQPTILFLGDIFGIMGYTATGGYGWNRDYEINSEEEFFELLKNKPELKDKVEKAGYSYLTGMAAISVKQISRLFYDYKHDFNVRLVSTFSIDESKTNNLIYVGPLKNFNPFIGLFNRQNNRFKIDNSLLLYKNELNVEDTLMDLNTTEKNFEYALVSRVPGPSNNEQMMFFSDHDIGVKAVVEYFTNSDSIKAFTRQHLSNSDYFTAVFGVNGEQRTNLELKLLRVDSF